MDFKFHPLDGSEFLPLFSMSDEELAEHNAVRQVVEKYPDVPCRVSLQDAPVGETVILLNYCHQSASSPYRSSHAIFVRENAQAADPAVNEVPKSLRERFLAIRAFDKKGIMLEADVSDGDKVDAKIQNMLSRENVDEVHVHYAGAGCFAAKARRA